MDELKTWMQQQLAERRVEPNSGLGDAIGFLQRHWLPLTRFLTEPGRAKASPGARSRRSRNRPGSRFRHSRTLTEVTRWIRGNVGLATHARSAGERED
jgi:hypothetical protein